MTAELTMLDYARVVARRHRLVLACVGGAVLAALIVTELMPKTYRAEATIFVQEQPSIINTVIGQTALQIPLPSGRSAEYVLAVLNSRALAESVVEEVDFALPARASAADRDPPSDLNERVGFLRKMLSTREKRGLITIRVESSDPGMASNAANAYVRNADRLLLKAATRRKKFIEGQLVEARQELAASEEALKRFQEQEKMIGLDVEMEESVKALVSLEEEQMKISASLAEASNMMQETGSLEEIAVLETRRAGLMARQSEVSRQLRRRHARMALVPSRTLQVARLKLGMELQLKRYTLLLEQYHLASIAEQQEEATFQTVDRATVPISPSKPRMMLNLALGGLFGLAAGVGAALLLDLWRPPIIAPAAHASFR